MPTTEELATTVANLVTTVTSLSEQIDFLLTRDRGMIVLYPIDKVPYGCLPCDGQIYAKDDPTYAALFEKIGFQYGGDGVTTFAVPDLRGEFVRVWDNGRGVDGGRAVGTSQSFATALPATQFKTTFDGSHTPQVRPGEGGHSHPVNPGVGWGDDGPQNYNLGKANGNSPNHMWAWSIPDNTGAHPHSCEPVPDHQHEVTGGDPETRPRNVALAAFIRF